MVKSLDYQFSNNGPLRGEVKVPGDKSISHRALMLSAIAQGSSIIKNLLMGADNMATLTAMQHLGVEISVDRDEIRVKGVGRLGLKPPSQVLDMGNAGTAIRLLTGLLAGQQFSTTLVGDASLSKRPMARIVNPLREMGADIVMSDQGTPPLNIKGGQQLSGIRYQMPIASAQVKSGILLAGLYAEGETTVIEPAPSRDHTERLLAAFGYPVRIKSQEVSLDGGHELHGISIIVPGDISSAAFFMVAALITPNSEITLKNVGINPTRTGIIDILKLMGANLEIINQRDQGGEPVADIVAKYSTLKGIEIPAQYVPLAIDEFPIIFIAAACAKGRTVLHNAQELRVKESDRIAAMAAGLSLLGIENQVFPDGIAIEGGTFHGGTIDSHGDHRIAMSFAIAANVAQAPILVRDCENISTSFPNFMEIAKHVGMNSVIHADL